MIRELYHFFRHAPEVAWKSTRMTHGELFGLLMQRADDAGFSKWRKELTAGLSGTVLELGCGTGRLFSYYSGDVRVVAIEPALDFLDIAREGSRAAAVPVSLVAGKGETLPFRDQQFDAIILCDVLCSVGNTDRTLRELQRILKSDGELRITTHVVSKKPVSRLLMNLFNPCWRLYNRVGCNMNRDTESDLETSGYHLQSVERYQLFCPGLPSFPSVFIRANPTP